ncbi:MAG: glycoside hydrolase family 43 protein [Actinomycetales bacterium]|nr:glycoside hydrolase family 43 protein [Actinomycetales bacterium]
MRTYGNPIARAGDFADPFVLRHDGRYYLYCTNPDVRCWSSRDLVSWRLEGPTVADDVFPGLVPFAPEVIYADGAFFMYTSPSGHGHVVLRSDSPTGPFVPVSGNVGHAIDGNVLIDDDGRWYFYWAGDEGIWGCEMTSPTEFGPPVFTGIHMNGWTEGPFVGKRDGRYWMTLTGNHYLSKGYRIDAASSDHPLTGYVGEPLNPVLISTTGHVVGLGHSSSVTGPDLVSTYLVYHNLNPDASRDLDIDRQVWTGGGLQVLGPTTSAPVPAPPDELCDWDAGGESRWTGSAGRVAVHESAGALPAEAIATWDVDTAGTFTAELNFTGPGHGLLLDGNIIRLPETLAPTALHRWCVIVDDGVQVRVDGAVILHRPHGGVARLGVASGASPVRIGHVALTRTVADAADRLAPRPVPGRFWAGPGDRALHVQAAGAYRVYLGGEAIATLQLEAGPSTLAITQGDGLVTVTAVPDGTTASVVNETIEGFGKRLLGDATWDDVTVDATVSAGFDDGDAHVDLLLRASQLAEGGEGDDTRLGIDFLLGYSVQLHRDRVVLARHAYDERILATASVPIGSGTHHVRVRARGAGISVELDGRSLVDVHDPLPYPAGAVGIRTSNARLHVERLELAAEGARPGH